MSHSRSTRSGERKLPEAVKDLDFVPHGGSGPAAAGRAGGAGGGRALVVVLDNGAVEVLDVDAKGALLCRVRPAKGGFVLRCMAVCRRYRAKRALAPGGVQVAVHQYCRR